MEMEWGHYLFVGVPEEDLTWLENKMAQRYGDVGEWLRKTGRGCKVKNKMARR